MRIYQQDLVRNNTFYVDVLNPRKNGYIYIEEQDALAPLPLSGFRDYKTKKQRPVQAYFDYNPRGERLYWTPGDPYPTLNVYQKPSWMYTKDLQAWIPKVYEDFLLRHLFAEDEASFEYVLDWMATSLVDRNYTFLVTIGKQGVGKGILGGILRRLHGPENFAQVRDDVIRTKFNSRVYRRTCVYIDEIRITRKEHEDRLKAFANDEIEIEGKGVDAGEYQNFASFYISSNRLDALPLDGDDRRFSIVNLTEVTVPEAGIEQDLIDEIYSEKSIGELGHFLLNRKVERDMMKPFASATKEALRRYNLAPWEEAVLEDVEGWEIGVNMDIENVKDRCLTQFDHAPPGRRAFEKLAKKFPEILQFSRPRDEEGKRGARLTKVGPADPP